MPPAQRTSEDVFRLVATWFYDVRSYDWGLLVSEVSGDLAYTVASERYTASRNGRPPVPTELRVTQCIGAWTDSGGGTPPRRPQATRATAATGTHAEVSPKLRFLIINRLALLMV